jgi:phospholipid/cholesterol/gamma-HCH transport system substrate-binding protein
MESKVSYTLVGAFVILLGGALLSVLVWLAAGTQKKTYDRYVAYVSESVSGLNTDAPVKYRGVGVGNVAAIELDHDNPERVQLLFDIERGTPIKQDTVATIASQGITGIAFVDLSGGTAGSPPLVAKEGQPYPEIRTAPSLFVRLDTAVSAMLRELTLVGHNLNQVAERVNGLLDENKQSSIQNTLANVEKLTGTLAARTEDIAKNAKNLDVILNNTAQASAELPQVVAHVNTLLASVDAAVGTIDRTAADLGAVAKQGEQRLGSASTRLMAEVDPVLGDLRALSASLRRLSHELEQRPQSLLFGRSRREPGPGEQEQSR